EARGCLIGPIGILYTASKSTRLRVPFGEGDEIIERPMVHDGVWIQNQDVLANGSANTGIVTLGKSEVGTVFDDARLWIVGFDEFNRAVGGTIVGNDDLETGAICGRIDRIEAIFNNLEIVPANDDD